MRRVSCPSGLPASPDRPQDASPEAAPAQKRSTARESRLIPFRQPLERGIVGQPRPGLRKGLPVHALIIEDEYLIARAIQDGLEDLGFTSFGFARSEDAAVLGADAGRIDLITADIRLLPGDGLKAVEAICARREIPVIFITGYAAELEDRLDKSVPRSVVIEKPFKPPELAAAVRQVLPLHRSRSDAA